MAEPKKQKNGMYKLRIRLKHPITGKWIERSTTQKTKKLCRDWETKARNDVLLGLSPDKVKLLTFYDTWYETFKKHKVGPDHETKIQIVRKRLVEFFGEDILLTQLDKFKYQQFINYLGSEEHLNLAKATVHGYHKILKGCLVEAQESGHLYANPARKAEIIGRDTTGEKKYTLDTNEWKKLLDAILDADECSSKYAALTMMFIGCRFQEVDGLTIADVNFKESTIRINKAYDYKRKKDYAPTKNAGSKRSVDMPSTLVNILKRYIYKSKIVSIDKNAPLFPNEIGIPITNAAINKFLTKRCKAAGIERVTSHALRHAKTDILVLAGADMIYVQKQLGHADAATTLKYYSALNDDIRDKNKKIFEAFLDKQAINT